MRYKKMTKVVLAAVIGMVLSGCAMEARRSDASQRRWQRTMDQARLEAARTSIDQGNLAYAERVLRTCARDAAASSRDINRANRMLAEVQTAHRHFAKARQDNQDPQDQVY